MTIQITLAAHVLTSGAPSQRLAPSEVVYLAGTWARAAYAVRSGQLAEYRLREDGREWIVRLLRPQDVFGLEALQAGADYCYTVEALGEAEIVPFLPAEAPAALLVEALNGQREAAVRRTEALVTQPLRARVAAFVLGEAGRAGVARNGGTFALSVTQKVLGAYEGTTQPHVAEALRKLADVRVLRLVGPRNQTRIRVSDVRRLRAEAVRESVT